MLRPVGEKPNRDRSSSSTAGNPAGDVCTCVHLRPRNPSGKLPRSLSSLLPFHRHERASRFENPLSDPAAMSSVSRCTWPGFGTGYCAHRLPFLLACTPPAHPSRWPSAPWPPAVVPTSVPSAAPSWGPAGLSSGLCAHLSCHPLLSSGLFCLSVPIAQPGCPLSVFVSRLSFLTS